MFKKGFIISLFFLFTPSIIVVADSFVPTSCTGRGADCGLDVMLAVFINIAQWILGIIGSITLLMIVYGGFLFIIGSQTGEKDKKINTGKDVLQNAIIGLIIVLCSYLVLQFIVKALGVDIKDNKIQQNTKK